MGQPGGSFYALFGFGNFLASQKKKPTVVTVAGQMQWYAPIGGVKIVGVQEKSPRVRAEGHHYSRELQDDCHDSSD